MERRGVGENSPVIRLIRGVYKRFRNGGPKARVGEESLSIVVFEKGIVREVAA